MTPRLNSLLSRALLAAAVVFAAGAAAAQERTPQDPNLFKPGQLTVSTSDPAFPPWVLDNAPEKGEGFEAALVAALAAKLGFAPDQVVWVREPFDRAIAPGAKPYDFSIQQVSVTEDRAKIAGFSQVYYQPAKALVALPESAVAKARSFADLRGARWGVGIGTTDLAYVENILGVKDAAVYDDQAGVFLALQGGLIDATVVSLPTALYVTAVQAPEAEIVALLPADAADRGHGLIFEQDNPIIPWIDEGLSALIEEGVVDELVARYLVADPDMPVISE